MPVKNKIKSFVDSQDMSVYEFWKKTSIAQRTAYDLYNEPWQLPSSTVLTKICDAFRIQPSELLEWVPPEERPAKQKAKSKT